MQIAGNATVSRANKTIDTLSHSQYLYVYRSRPVTGASICDTLLAHLFPDNAKSSRVAFKIGYYSTHGTFEGLELQKGDPGPWNLVQDMKGD